MLVRHGVMSVGPTGGGKTVSYQVKKPTTLLLQYFGRSFWILLFVLKMLLSIRDWYVLILSIIPTIMPAILVNNILVNFKGNSGK